MLNRIHEFILPQPIQRMVDSVCNTERLEKDINPRPPHLLIPVDSGNGRTSILSAIASHFRTFGAIEFSSRDLFLEFKLTGTAGNVYTTDIEIQENAEYSNHFCGIIGFDIDSLLPKLSDTPGEKFFEMAADVKQHATVIIFVPADCAKKSINLICAKTGVTLRPLPPVTHTESDYLTAFSNHLSLIAPSAAQRANVSKQAAAEYIGQAFQRPTMRDVLELAEAAAFDEGMLKRLFGKSDSDIERGELI